MNETCPYCGYTGVCKVVAEQPDGTILLECGKCGAGLIKTP